MSRSNANTPEVQRGTITGVEDHSTIVIVRLLVGEGWSVPVFFDHRAFAWLLDGEGCLPEDLVGRRASFDGAVLNLERDDE